MLCTAICPELVNPNNGMVVLTGRFVGDTATYTCNPGHELNGPDVLNCVDGGLVGGTWDDRPPTCERKLPFETISAFAPFMYV